MKSICTGMLLVSALLSVSGAAAEPGAPPSVVVNQAVGVPVFPNDIKDWPYDVIGEVSAGVRKATIFSPEADQKKIYEVLWKNAKKLGADAVVNAKYGDSHVSAFSWGKTNVTGTAIKFKPVG